MQLPASSIQRKAHNNRANMRYAYAKHTCSVQPSASVCGHMYDTPNMLFSSLGLLPLFFGWPMRPACHTAITPSEDRVLTWVVCPAVKLATPTPSYSQASVLPPRWENSQCTTLSRQALMCAHHPQCAPHYMPSVTTIPSLLCTCMTPAYRQRCRPTKDSEQKERGVTRASRPICG